MSHPGERPPRATAATPKCRRPIGYHFPPMDPPPQPYPSPSKAQWAAVEEAELVRDDAVLGSVAVAVAVDEDAASPSSTAPAILGVVALRTRADNGSNPGHTSSSFWLHFSRVGVLSAACAAVRDWILPEAVGMGEVLVEYLVVAPSVRRRGVGRALLEWAAAEARCLVAADAEAVRAGSQPVLALWVRRPWFRGQRSAHGSVGTPQRLHTTLPTTNPRSSGRGVQHGRPVLIRPSRLFAHPGDGERKLAGAGGVRLLFGHGPVAAFGGATRRGWRQRPVRRRPAGSACQGRGGAGLPDICAGVDVTTRRCGVCKRQRGERRWGVKLTSDGWGEILIHTPRFVKQHRQQNERTAHTATTRGPRPVRSKARPSPTPTRLADITMPPSDACRTRHRLGRTH